MLKTLSAKPITNISMSCGTSKGVKPANIKEPPTATKEADKIVPGLKDSFLPERTSDPANMPAPMALIR